MTEEELLSTLFALFPQAGKVTSGGTTFWFAAGDRRQMMPFLTLVTDDEHDAASNLGRPGVYRLNVGLSADEYRGRFGPPPPALGDGQTAVPGHDPVALDVLMPHPVYAALHWACVLNPSPATLARLTPLLQAAYDRASRRVRSGT